MILHSLCLLLLCGALAEKEVEEEYTNALTKKLIHELQKRLMAWEQDTSESQEQITTRDGGSCSYDVVESTIIRTQDSLDAGAKFLQSFTSQVDREMCQTKCCEEKTCNLAVIKEKVSDVAYIWLLYHFDRL